MRNKGLRKARVAASETEANFDRVASVYRWGEYLALGPLLQWARESFLRELRGCQQALVLGDGDGRFTAALLGAHPAIKVMAVDTSAKMLALLRRRCSVGNARLTVRQESALEVQPVGGTDLVVTHFLLDCFVQGEVDALTKRLGGAAAAGTLWLVSDFAVPDRGWMRPLAWLYVRLLYWVFARLTGLRVRRLPDPQRALRAAGFGLMARRERLGGLLYAELWRRG